MLRPVVVVIGLTLLLALIVIGLIRAIRYFLKERTMLAAFPTLALGYVIIANISLSLILESEVFVWVVVLAILVSAQHKSHATTEYLTDCEGNRSNISRISSS